MRSRKSGFSVVHGDAWKTQLVTLVTVAFIGMLAAQKVQAAGGCGSVCLPLEILDPEKTQLKKHQLRLNFTAEHAKFDNFREGGSSITNPGGNEGIISQAAMLLDYGLTERFTASLLLPYVHKKQETNRFGTRTAGGIGDFSVFGRYEVITPNDDLGPSVALGLGIKFPTGGTQEPDPAQLLPPAFQTGSGAFDLVPTVSYYQDLSSFTVFGDAFARIPLDENDRGYKFGREYALSGGASYELPVWGRRFSVLLLTSYLYAGHDEDSDSVLPARVRDGSRVLNTGGRFLDFIPGFRLSLNERLAVQVRFPIPVYEDWNGDASLNVGQVAPDLGTQINLMYRFSLK